VEVLSVNRTNLFRKASLERLSSPEQLDSLMTVTKPIGWLALLAMLAVIVLTGVWSVYGMLPDKVSGAGILIKSGGVYEIVASSAGQISDIRVTDGETIQKGQIIARISQPTSLEELAKSRETLRDLEKQRQQIQTVGGEGYRFQQEMNQREKVSIERQIQNDRNNLVYLQKRINSQEDLLRQGLITNQQLIATRQDHERVTTNIADLERKLGQLDLSLADLDKKNDAQVQAIDRSIAELRRKIDLMVNHIDFSTNVYSPYKGVILEIKQQEGGVVSLGTPILSLELIGSQIMDLQAVIYLSPFEGKRVKKGMEVQISPATVKQEEYGFIKGRVVSVSEFPSTPQQMNRLLKNDVLVKDLMNNGAPIQVIVDLVPAEDTVSGFRWSSPEGPPIKLNTGTMCAASIIVEKRQPISLVIPMLKKHLLGAGA
jgi:HlyD family secretion protein